MSVQRHLRGLKVTIADSSASGGVKELKGRSVESIGHAQAALESLELLKRDEPENKTGGVTLLASRKVNNNVSSLKDGFGHKPTVQMGHHQL